MIYRRLVDFPSFRFKSPFEELERMRHQLDRLSDSTTSPFFQSQAGVFPLINLTEDKDNYYVRAEMPGVKADELDIQATAKNIAISGERKIATEEDGTRYHRREREAGKFSRMIGLPDEIDTEKVDAKMENGLLKIVVAKAEAVKPKQISVKSS